MSLVEYLQTHLHPKSEEVTLVDQIKTGIAKTGCCILDDNELESVWDNKQVSADEKRLALEQFARHYSFRMELTPHVKAAVFTNPEHPWQPIHK